MGEIVPLILAFLAGTGIGLFYFGGLWFTAQWLSRVRRPVVLAVGSFLLRTLLALVAFFLVMGGRWPRLVAALLGFIAMRTMLLHWVGLPEETLGKDR